MLLVTASMTYELWSAKHMMCYAVQTAQHLLPESMKGPPAQPLLL